MTTRLSFLKGGVHLSAGQVISQSSVFLKSLIVARLISPADYGIAAIFAMTFSLLEMISNLSAQLLIVQAEDGDNPRFERTIHFVHASRGMLNATLTFLLAGPVSTLFGAPKAKLAFECLALVPLIRGFYHLDINRFQRHMRFAPFVFVDSGSNLLVTLIALPLAFWLRSYWAMLWLLVAQSACILIGSHWLAERPYRWAWDRFFAKRMFHFGWPLTINGLLMFGIFEGDRFFIGSAHRLFSRSNYTLTDLGVYSVAFALTQAPGTIAANMCTSLFLPLLSLAQGLRVQFERRYLACAQVVSLIAVVVAMGFIVAGGRVVTLVYGQKYAAAGVFIGWLSAMCAVRILRYAPTLAAMAYADTRNAMVSNLARSSALVGMLFVAATGRSPVWIAVCGFLGELLALVVCVWRLQLRHGVPATMCFKPFAAFFVGIGVSALVVVGGIARLGLAPIFLSTACLIMLQAVSMICLFPGVREELGTLVLRVRSSLAAGKVAT
ncbi:MAG TPA: oligosaccharide flippase family protein [Terriglobia bacterium]|nr:oligosaccharide flippase family protein [Terriglobia bacterium]